MCVASAFRAELRRYDLCARFGGDEFLVVLPETSEEEAAEVARRVQAWLAVNPIPTREGPFTVGVSIGTAELRDDESRIGETMERADAAMYAEKRAGGRSFLTVG
jgi:diguanylate cyclase (GGDEF)-like protein